MRGNHAFRRNVLQLAPGSIATRSPTLRCFTLAPTGISVSECEHLLCDMPTFLDNASRFVAQDLCIYEQMSLNWGADRPWAFRRQSLRCVHGRDSEPGALVRTDTSDRRSNAHRSRKCLDCSSECKEGTRSNSPVVFTAIRASSGPTAEYVRPIKAREQVLTLRDGSLLVDNVLDAVEDERWVIDLGGHWERENLLN